MCVRANEREKESEREREKTVFPSPLHTMPSAILHVHNNYVSVMYSCITERVCSVFAVFCLSGQ